MVGMVVPQEQAEEEEANLYAGQRGQAHTANHHSHCLLDYIALPHMGRECVDPSSVLCLF
jgi:hypothetical protein